jgi:hypothetical protein
MVARTEAQPVAFSADLVDDITIFEVRGAATPADVIAIFRGFPDRPTPLVLWDMRAYDLSHLADELPRWASDLTLPNCGRRLHGRSAFVFSRDADAYVMHMLIAHAEASGYGIPLAVFRDIDEARRWLAKA